MNAQTLAPGTGKHKWTKVEGGYTTYTGIEVLKSMDSSPNPTSPGRLARRGDNVDHPLRAEEW